MNRTLFACSAFALATALAAGAYAQGAGKVSTRDFTFAVPAAPAPALKLYTSSQYPYQLRTGGVRVAVGDVNGDGVSEQLTLSGAGAQAHIKVFDGRSGAELSNVTPASLGAGVGDANGDGKVDIIINRGGPAGIIINRGGIIINKDGAPTASGHVKVFDGATGAPISVASAPAR